MTVKLVGLDIDFGCIPILQLPQIQPLMPVKLVTKDVVLVKKLEKNVLNVCPAIIFIVEFAKKPELVVPYILVMVLALFVNMDSELFQVDGVYLACIITVVMSIVQVVTVTKLLM